MTFKWTLDTKESSVVKVKESQTILSVKIHVQCVIQRVKTFKIMRIPILFEAIYLRIYLVNLVKAVFKKFEVI